MRNLFIGTAGVALLGFGASANAVTWTACDADDGGGWSLIVQGIDINIVEGSWIAPANLFGELLLIPVRGLPNERSTQAWSPWPAGILVWCAL